MKRTIVIVGGGLSGLYAARLLAAAGLDFVLLEARDRLGGRILSAAADRGGFDLGPSWFWPDMQPMMVKLVEELGLTAFAQHTDGDVVVERSAAEPAQRFRSPWETAPSFRIAGGTATADLSTAFAQPASSTAVTRRVAEVVYTLTRFPSVRRVVIQVDGALLTEIPEPSESATPLALAGSASVFEGTFVASIRSSGGKLLAKSAVQASQGAPGRGAFSASLSFSSTAPAGLLVVYQVSMENGSKQDVVRIPLAFAQQR